MKSAMHKKKWIFSVATALILLGVVLLLIFFFQSSGDTGSPRDNNSAGTAGEPLDPNLYHVPGAPYARGLSLIFFSDGYLSWDEFDRDADVLMRALKSVEPWQSFSHFNIYRIKPRENDICEVKIENERKPVLRCDPQKLNSYLNRLETGPFKLVVLSRRNFQSWANISGLRDSGIFFSIPSSPNDPSSQALIAIPFLHLMGHAFGLKDEELFVIAQADSAGNTAGGPNCAPDRATAEQWWGELAKQYPDRVGYFPGCAGHADYISPHRGSIMNLGDLSHFVPEYGLVSEEYLRKILRYCFSEKKYALDTDPSFFERYQEFQTCTSR